MAVYPPQLTPEEKSLKKRYARLQEKRQLLRKAQGKTSPSAVSKKLPKDGLNPKDAKEAAKRLLDAGKLTIKAKPAPRRTGFKRVGEMPGESPPSKKPNTPQKTMSQPHIPSKPQIKASDVREVYNRTFVRASNAETLKERIPKKHEEIESVIKPENFSTQECTIYVYGSQITEQALRIAFSRFGDITTISTNKSSAFITFGLPSVADKAREEMNGGMIHGSDILVAEASRENGYIELPPEAAADPWSLIAAGKEDSVPFREVHHKRRKVQEYTNDYL